MRSFLSIALIALWVALPPAPARAGEPTGRATAITSIRAVGSRLVVTVAIPAGKRRVTLETRPRLVRGAWTPREARWSEAAAAGEITFELPVGADTEMVRVRDESEAEVGLPAGFFSGTKEFAGTKQTETAFLKTAGPGVIAFDNAAAGIPTTGTPADRAVVESDIWNVDGRTVYFFNQQRGLQVIDLADADHPVLTGTLPLAVWGEQMYRLPAATADGSVWLALLAQQGCSGNASEVLLVQVKAGRPSLAGRLPVRGQIKETRLVGNALYIASYDWSQPEPRPVTDAQGNITGYEYQPWESRTVVTAYDLADPSRPAAQPEVELPVSPDAIMATDRFLFVAVSGTRQPKDNERPAAWAVAGNHAVMVFDISDPRGAVAQRGFFLTAGRVADKFKLGPLGKQGGALAVVSQVDGVSIPTEHLNKDGSAWTSWSWTPPQTVLQTFSLADPSAPIALGRLNLVTNESLFGTRFSGDRAYVVTFRRVDPLWIVDLSDPVHPTVKGELQIPGYSTYLQPLADDTRLLALGVDGSRTTVQLFDVADAAKPALLSKVFLGEGWSWSEGNTDEKAFQVFADAGLALVPWQGRRSGAQAGQWFQGMQLIDLDLRAGTLKARGVIDHAMQARRATLLGDRIVSVSGQDLLTVEASDRDRPKTVAELPLSTQVDRVFVVGDRLVTLRDGSTVAGQIDLASASAPEKAIATLPLEALPIIGADRRGDSLYVVQFRADGWRTEATIISNAVVKKIGQPPLEKLTTNFVVVEVPPPTVIIAVTNTFIRQDLGSDLTTTNVTVQDRKFLMPASTRWVTTTTTTTFPPSPDDPVPASYRLTWIRPEFTPMPSTWQTNAMVDIEFIPVPPLRVTNWVAETSWQSVRVPGASRFSVVELGADTLRLRSQMAFENPADFYGGALKALWPGDKTVVWTQRSSGYSWGGGGPMTPFSKNVAVADVAVPGFAPGFTTGMSADRFWWGGWYGSETRDLLAFDVADPAAPVLASRTRLGGTNDWNRFSDTFVADGKLFVGHQVSRYSAAPETVTIVTNKDGSLTRLPVWQPGTWEHRQFLDVLDFTDAAEPVVRTPVGFPGTLSGVSHDGSLVYATGPDPKAPSDTAVQQLHALAYDGLQASLVTSLPLPAAYPRPLLVRPDGQVLLGRAAATTNETPALETWAVSSAGRFDRYASLKLAVAADDLHVFGDLLVVSASDRFLSFGAADATALVPVGEVDRPCAVWPDWAGADASPATGLWLPRGGQGLWHVPLRP